MFVSFFFSSRSRHTSCALVTGVQTCALPISADETAGSGSDIVVVGVRSALQTAQERKKNAETVVDSIDATDIGAFPDNSVSCALQRSEERRVGKECVSTCRSRWSPYN